MAFCSFSKEATYSGKTGVDNTFLRKFMPTADGTAVKIYLLGLCLCSTGDDLPIEGMAELLSVTVEDIENAFLFWEDCGLVSVVSRTPFSVRYLAAEEGRRKPRPEKYTGFNRSLQAIFPEREISVSEYGQYMQLLEDQPISQDALLLVVRYCRDYTGNPNLRFNYVKTTVMNFLQKGIRTAVQVEKELSSYSMDNESLSKLYQAMGIKKKPELSDSDYLKEWRKLEFEFDNILFVASTLKRGNMQKLDSALKELYANRCFSKEEIDYYLSRKKALYRETFAIAKKLGVYLSYAETYVEKYTAVWSSYGYSDEALDIIANYAFATQKKSFEGMDEIVREWYGKGIVSLESIRDHLLSIKEDEDFLAKLFQTCSLSRRPIGSDFTALRNWRSWGFSDEMILLAGEESAGKANPIPYLTAILSSWKTKKIFVPSDIPKRTSGSTEKLPDWKRATTKEEIDALIAESAKRYQL
ncbi:MAG: DnaD domain protein [Clostridia bacterium]|nr:DnaD domain protein [Clostridia bacterium]